MVRGGARPLVACRLDRTSPGAQRHRGVALPPRAAVSLSNNFRAGALGAEIRPKPANICRFGPSLGRSGRNVTNTVGRTWPGFCQSPTTNRPKLGPRRSMLVKFGPNLIGGSRGLRLPGPSWADFGQCCSNLAQHRPDSAQMSPNLAQHGQFWPTLDRTSAPGALVRQLLGNSSGVTIGNAWRSTFPDLRVTCNAETKTHVDNV